MEQTLCTLLEELVNNPVSIECLPSLGWNCVWVARMYRAALTVRGKVVGFFANVENLEYSIVRVNESICHRLCGE